MIYRVESNKESFFTIDTETIGNNDTGIVTNLAMVYVNMPIVEGASESILSFSEFVKLVDAIDIYPSIEDQKNYGRNVGGGALEFWKEQMATAKKDRNERYENYIRKMMIDGDHKISVSATIDAVHNFIGKNVILTVNDGKMKDKDIPFLERGGGFDTNKFYSMRESIMPELSRNNCKYIPHWSRRELRTILSTNSWRDIDIFVSGTNWSKDFSEMVFKDSGMVKHMAVLDALLDAYGIYCLKLTQPKFYL